MTVLLHVCIAIASLAYTTYVFFKPSVRKLHISYGLVAATIASGTILAVQYTAHMIETCTMGLLFLGISLVGIIATQRKLAAERLRD